MPVHGATVLAPDYKSVCFGLNPCPWQLACSPHTCSPFLWISLINGHLGKVNITVII